MNDKAKILDTEILSITGTHLKKLLINFKKIMANGRPSKEKHTTGVMALPFCFIIRKRKL